MVLHIDDAVKSLGVQAVAVIVDQLDNHHYTPQLEHWLADQYTQLQQESPAQAAHRQQVLAGFQQLRQTTGRSWKRFPASSAALWDQFQRRGELVRINPAVDIYNLLSLQTGLSLGGHDCLRLSGPVRLCLTVGGEPFRALGSDRQTLLSPGEYIYRDEIHVLCRMDHRQAESSRLTMNSTQALFIVQGHHGLAPGEIEQTRDRLVTLLGDYCCGETRSP